MQKQLFKQSAVLGLCFASLLSLSSFTFGTEESAISYVSGDTVSADVFVSDKNGSQVSLVSLLKQESSQVNVLFIFGGGDLSFDESVHRNLWCPDSFEDTYILRTLLNKYQGKGVNFIAVAAAPVYHSDFLGFPARVFLDESTDSEAFQAADQAFIDSTMLAVKDGTLPIEPYFDSRFRLMLNRNPTKMPGAEYGEVFAWQGAFRKANETQNYGVPTFWILSNDGEVLAEPLRGNVYYPHGAEVNISYSFSDIDKLLQSVL